jgi:hypothetical protein
VRLLEKLGLVLLITLIVLGSLLVYLQTRHGFRHVILPLSAKLTGARLEVRDGMLTLAGSLHIEGLRYEDPTLGVAMDVQRLALRGVPWSFLTEGVPRIDDFELQHAKIWVEINPDEAGAREANSAQTRTRLALIAVERARLEDVTVVVEQADRRFTGRVDAMVTRLGPGQSGNVTLQTGFLIERRGVPDLLGTIDLNLPVEIASGGTLIQWNGSNRVLLRTSGGALDPADPEVVQIEQTLVGNYEPASQTLRAASHFAISRAATELGTIDLTGENAATRPTVTDVSLIWTDARGEMLNLWWREAAGPHVQAGRFNAQFHVHNEGTRTSVQVNATGSGVRLRWDESEASPPIELSLKHVGSFDSTTMVVTMETLTVNVTDGVRTLLSGALDRPVSLNLDRFAGQTRQAETDPQPAVWSLHLTQVDIKGLRPWLALLGRNTLREVAAGQVEGGLVISMYDQGATVDVAGHFEGTGILVRSEGNGRTGSIGPLGVVVDWKSRMTGMQQLKVDPATTTVSLKGKQVAALHATGEWRLADPAGFAGLNGSMTLMGLPGRSLNTLLGLWSEVRIGRAQIDGRAEIVVDEREARWEVDLRSRGLQLHMPATATDAPPLNLEIAQTGKLDRTGRALRLDRMHVQVVEGQRPVVTIALDQPLIMSLAQEKKGNVSNTDTASDQVTLNLRINRLGVHQVRPWIAMAGSQAFPSVRGGVLDMDLTIRFEGADDIAVAGRLDLERVTFARGTTHLSVPLTFGTEIRASIANGSRLSVDSWVIRALDRSQQLAQGRLTGSADFAGTTNLVLDVNTADLSDLMDRLGFLSEQQHRMISGGNLEGDVRVVRAGPDQPLTVKTGLRVETLHIRLDKAHQMTRTIGVQAEVAIDGARTMADIRRIEVGVESAGSNAGSLLMSGRWPLTAQPTMTPIGSISVTLKEWDSQPFVDFLGVLPGHEASALMVTGALKVTQKADGRATVVQGRETVGPIKVAVKGRAAAEKATVHVEHDVTLRGDEIQIAALSINSERPMGQADHMTMKGNARWGLRPHLQLRGSVDALDADWYAALTAPRTGGTREERPSTGQQSVLKENEADFALPLDLDVDLAIGTLIYRNLAIGTGRLIAKGDGQGMQATLEPTGLAGGSVQGTFAIAQKGAQQDITWDAKGNSLDLGLLTKALFTEPEGRITGLGKFITSGRGRGQREALGNSLDGLVVFDVENGRFVKSPVMEFLAKQTRIDEFNDAGFKTLHGELHIKDGWMQLNQARAVGSMYAIEAAGKIGLDGRLDAQIFPKVGPAFSKHVKIPCLDQFAKASDGFTVLPVTVTVKGTTGNPEYGAKVETAGTVKRRGGELVGVIADLLTGCQGGDSMKN